MFKFPYFLILRYAAAATTVLQSCSTLCDPYTAAHQAPLSLGFSRQETGVGCHALLRGIFLTQGSNLRLLHLLQCRRILYHWAIGEAFFMWSGEAPNYSYPFSLTFFLHHYQSRVTMTQDWPIIISHLFGNSQPFKNRHTILTESIKILPWNWHMREIDK